MAEAVPGRDPIDIEPAMKIRERRFSVRKIPGAATLMVIGAAAVGAARFDGCDMFEESGKLLSYDPPNRIESESIDQRFTVVTWNMHGEILRHTDDIREIAVAKKVDVFSFQEVLESEFEEFNRRFPGWHMRYVVADSNSKIIEGALGNMLMTRQKPKDESTSTIAGSSGTESVVRTVAGLETDLSDIPANGVSFDHTKDGKQEDRAVVIETIKVWDADTGRERDVKVAGSHISRTELIHDDQFADLMGFIKDNLDDDTPLVFAGDLNTHPEEARNAFLKLGMDVPLHKGGAVGRRRQIDYVAVYPADVLGVPSIRPLFKYKTDHYPIEVSFNTDSAYE